MFCPKCGNQIFDEAVICPHCGCQVQTAPLKQNEANALGICAIIFSILGGWLGLVLSIIGLCGTNEGNKNLSKIGIGLCIAWFFIFILLLA